MIKSHLLLYELTLEIFCKKLAVGTDTWVSFAHIFEKVLCIDDVFGCYGVWATQVTL